MRISPAHPYLTGPVLLASLLVLSGCGDSLTRNFGLTREVPDEFTVTTRAPLSMPPDYNLRPPRPGATRPQEQSERQQAEQALVPQLALGAPKGDTSPGQEALMAEAGPSAPADIRKKIDQDAHMASADQGFIDKVLYWRKTNPEHVQVDPQKESQRLRQNAALGEPPNIGDTPIIQQKKTGWFTDLFSWL
ncbi:MAG TPA: DUF3035 domain-containing protein [Rhodopila sp.]|nr:DUF3035 domain-containing protein [Rhodopila sp.]